MSKFMKNLEIFPSVISLLYLNEKYKKYDNSTHLHTILACGYRDMGEEERRQFIDELQAEGEDTSWIPFITNQEKIAYYDSRAKEQGKKTIAEEAEAAKKRKEREMEREQRWLSAK